MYPKEKLCRAETNFIILYAQILKAWLVIFEAKRQISQSEEDLGNLVVSDVLKLQDGERTTTWYSTYSKMPSTAW